MIYVLICLCLSLAGVAGLQFFYMVYLEQIGKGYKRRVRELERHCIKLSARLDEAEARAELIERTAGGEAEQHEDDEVWADVIEDY
jgi:hypothetical protein